MQFLSMKRRSVATHKQDERTASALSPEGRQLYECVLKECAANSEKGKRMLTQLALRLPKEQIAEIFALEEQAAKKERELGGRWMVMSANLLSLVFDFLEDFEKLLSLEFVCKRWQQLSKDGCGWRTLIVSSRFAMKGTKFLNRLMEARGKTTQRLLAWRLDLNSAAPSTMLQRHLRELCIHPISIGLTANSLLAMADTLEVLTLVGSAADSPTARLSTFYSAALMRFSKLRRLVVHGNFEFASEPLQTIAVQSLAFNSRSTNLLQQIHPSLERLVANQNALRCKDLQLISRFPRLEFLKLRFFDAFRSRMPPVDWRTVQIGDLIDAQDHLGKWYRADIFKVDYGPQRQLRVYYHGWDPKSVVVLCIQLIFRRRWDEWILADGLPRLAVAGTRCVAHTFALDMSLRDAFCHLDAFASLDCRPGFLLTQLAEGKLTDSNPLTRLDIDVLLDLPCFKSQSLKYLSCSMQPPRPNQLKLLAFVETLEIAVENCDDRTAEALSAIPNVRWLQLLDGPITDSGLQHISRMPGLQRLILLDLDHISDAGIAHLRSKRLEVLRIGCPQLNGSTLRLLNVRDLYLHKISAAEDTLSVLVSNLRLKSLATVDWQPFNREMLAAACAGKGCQFVCLSAVKLMDDEVCPPM